MKLKALLFATALVCGAPAVASAQETTASWNVGAASSYQFRGVTQAFDGDFDAKPQVFGGLDLSAGDFYVGTWLSNVDFGGKANLEVDLYAGYKPKIGPVTMDFGVLAYTYPQETDTRVFEGKIAGTVANESGMSLTGAVYYSPEYGKDGPSYWYYEAIAVAPIPGAKVGPFSLSANASVGFTDVESNPILSEYTNWKVGLTAATESGWAVDVFYTDTDLEDVTIFEGKGVVQLKRTF